MTRNATASPRPSLDLEGGDEPATFGCRMSNQMTSRARSQVNPDEHGRVGADLGMSQTSEEYATNLSVRSLNAVQTVTIVAVAGSVLAATIPAFVTNLRASRLSEPVEALNQIALHATLYAVGRPISIAYPTSVGQTPARVPAGQRVADPPGTWDHPTWRRLDFRMLEPHGFATSSRVNMRRASRQFRFERMAIWMATGLPVLSR